jgi:transglutaminase-like putative cysteine protease
MAMHLGQARKSFLAGLPPGEKGTAQTLRMMRSLVNQYKRAGDIRENALSLLAGLRPKDWVGEVNSIFSFVRDHVRYVRDIHGVETIQTPLATLDLQAGDCDDKSTLLATLLESVGHPTRFVAVGYERPGAYSHVYVETRIGRRWIPLDATILQPMGWSPRPSKARLVVHN